MKFIDIVVPAKNEQDNLPELFERIHRSLTKNRIPYGIVLVDDNSTDNTGLIARNYSRKYPIEVVTRNSNPGKAFAIVDGIKKTTAEYIAIIDADLQYPPELLPKMYAIAKAKDAVVVARRKTNKTGFVRKVASKLNALLFSKLLQFNCDTQSGLKVFKRSIALYLDSSAITKWTIDMHLLKIAKDLGFEIESVDCVFTERKNGFSKIRIVNDSFEIAKEAIKIAFSRQKPYLIAPTSKMIGAGVHYRGKQYITHTTLPLTKSAIFTFTIGQKAVIGFLFMLLGVGLFINAWLTAVIFIAGLSFIYFADVLFTFFTLMKSLHSKPEMSFSDAELDNIVEADLPIYSILCPLYKESQVLPIFIDSIQKIDWPKNKLEVLLLLEEKDPETIKTAEMMKLPPYVRIIIVPESQPKTKPKACNYGLSLAKGEYVVIYDAEDRPDPYQLKKAYLGFRKVDDSVVCLQSKLNYYNDGQNLLTRLFTAEYSLWFDIVLPGFQSIRTVIPLGGTSNHFKTNELYKLGGWDPFNVTEDCDLGVRLFKEGKKTAIIDSTTYEEANSNVKNWIRQRSRWIKGYYQTYLVHMRNPIRFFKDFGFQAFIFQLIIGMRTSFMLINPLLWITTISYFALYAYIGPAIESLFPPFIFYIATIALVAGNFLHLYNYMIGCAKRGNWSTVKYVYFIPFYWFLSSIASFMALYQLIRKPFYWEKTNHGLHLKVKKEKEESTVRNENSIDSSFSIIYKNIKELTGIFTFRKYDIEQKTNLRVLIFNWRDTKHTWAGGAEAYLHEIAKRWVNEGISVTVFCGRDGKTPSHEIVDGVEIIRKGGFYTVYLWAFIYYLLKLRGKYDIVLDSENGIPFFTPLFVGIPKILLIYHVHQNYLKELGVFPMAHIARLLESKGMPFFYKNVPIVTVSESAREDILKLGMGSAENISIISPGVDTTSYKRSVKTEYPSFSYLGRLKAYKNIDVAIRAFHSVVKVYPNAKFTIAGMGEAEEDLKALCKKLQLQDSVIFAGKVTEKEKYTILSKSWASIQPSSHEGWGMTVIEANVVGTMVIGSKVHGLCDSIQDNVTGLLVEVKNVDKFAKAMQMIIKDTEKREKLTNAAFLWSKRFGWGTIAHEMLSVVKSELHIEGTVEHNHEYVIARD